MNKNLPREILEKIESTRESEYRKKIEKFEKEYLAENYEKIFDFLNPK